MPVILPPPCSRKMSAISGANTAPLSGGKNKKCLFPSDSGMALGNRFCSAAAGSPGLMPAMSSCRTGTAHPPAAGAASVGRSWKTRNKNINGLNILFPDGGYLKVQTACSSNLTINSSCGSVSFKFRVSPCTSSGCTPSFSTADASSVMPSKSSADKARCSKAV